MRNKARRVSVRAHSRTAPVLGVIIFLAGSAPAQAPNVLYTFNGGTPYDEFGIAVSGARDVNGDGFDDVIVGAQLEDRNGLNSGSARVFSGKDGSVLHLFEGQATGDRFGNAVRDAGDVNADGVPDVIIGAYLDDQIGYDTGSARVHSGADGRTLYTFYGDSAWDQFGRSVGGAGDVNGDGFDDVIVGATHDGHNGGVNVGSAWVFSGRDGSLLYTFYGDAAEDKFGHWVSSVGDLNGDGRPELIVGAPQPLFDGTGYVRVFDGATGQTLKTLFGVLRGDEFGFCVGAAGDVDRDGIPDLIVGVPEAKDNGNDSGLARVFSGADYRILHTFKLSKSFDYFGRAVDGAGDVNGDGFADLVVGSPYDDQNGINSGTVFVFSGRDGQVLHRWFGDSQEDYLGFTVSGAGNVNGLGFPDLIGGAPWDDNNGSSSGSARVFCGGGVPVSSTFGVGCPASRPLSLALAGTPALGSSLSIDLSNGPPGQAAAVLDFGQQRGAPYPLDLSPIGMPSCSLYHSAEATLSLVLNNGSASSSLSIPAAPMLCGAAIYTQGLALDPAANALGVITSNAGQLVIGF